MLCSSKGLEVCELSNTLSSSSSILIVEELYILSHKYWWYSLNLASLQMTFLPGCQKSLYQAHIWVGIPWNTQKCFPALPMILPHWTVSQMIKLLLLWQGVKHSLADPRGSEVKDATGSHGINILVHNRDQNSVYGWYCFSAIYCAIISSAKVIKDS